MKRESLSVIIVAKNEEENIKDCLESVRWADEIIVVDDCSDDKTREIARKYTKKIFVHKLENFGKQLEYALKKSTKEWVLWLDADERVTPKLKHELDKILKKPKYNGYHAFFEPVFLGKKFKYIKKDVQGTIRLFRRDGSILLTPKIHPKVLIKGEYGVLRNMIEHHSHRSVFQIIKKFNENSSFEAQELYEAGGGTNLFYFILAPINIFLRRLFLEGYYREGMRGLMAALVYAYYYSFKHMKLWELQFRNSSKKNY